MQYQLPPRGFWIRQTGGMSVLDAAMLCMVLLLNLMWFCTGMQREETRYSAREAGILER